MTAITHPEPPPIWQQVIRNYDRRHLGNPACKWRTECRFRGVPGILEIYWDASGWRARFLQPAADTLRAGTPITQPDSFWRCVEAAAALVNLPLDAVLKVIQ